MLRTGCQWKALPRERFGSASAIHKRFLEWEAAGGFQALWRAGLAEYDQMEGIAWTWQSIDDGLPLYHEIFEGNTGEVSTLKPIIEKIVQRYPVKRIIAVADRGLLSIDNLAPVGATLRFATFAP